MIERLTKRVESFGLAKEKRPVSTSSVKLDASGPYSWRIFGGAYGIIR
jgi:hypothetical protein